MVIGIDASRAFDKERTGTENYSFALINALAKLKTKTQFIVYLRPNSNIDQKDWPDNFRFVTLSLPRLWTQVGLAAATFIYKMDVLFVPSHTLPVIHSRNLKTVVTVHDLGAEYLPKTHQLKQRLYLKWITNFQLKSATKIIAVSNATKNDLIQKVHIPSSKIEVIYEGVNREVFRVIKDDILRDVLKHFDVEDQKYFLFVGTIQPRKNLIRLIEAFSRFTAGPVSSVSLVRPHPDLIGTAVEARDPSSLPPASLKLVLVGAKGWMFDQIYALPKKLGIEDKVKFLGRVSDTELATLYRGSKGLVYPSLFEGFGLPILEAFACGCPVLTSNISSMPEIAGEAAILVDPYSVDDIVKGMIRIINQELRVRLIKAGLAQVDKFSWENCAQKTLAVLEEVANATS